LTGSARDPAPARDRRKPAERRLSIFHALWRSSFVRRRIAPRRGTDRHPVMTDWYQAHWLAPAILILILSIADALLTLTLVARGATEINPLMKPLVAGSGEGFAYWKLGLTSIGVIVLTMAARLRILGGIAVGSILYLILFGYLALVGYEIALLRIVPPL
jgi:Domain of unknown function (DUF5658)